VTAAARNTKNRKIGTSAASAEELSRKLGLESKLGHDGSFSAAAASLFPYRAPQSFIDRMAKGDPRDPLLLQVLPVEEETRPAAGFVPDPLEEKEASPVSGVLHKYSGRALLLVSGVCAIHCRYCFRRHFPYAEHELTGARLDAALDYLRHDESITEVILSGGDPLSASDDYLSRLCDRLAAIPHLEWLRVHSRVPIVLPRRIDGRMIDWLTRTRLKPVMVVHCNHPAEIDDAVIQGLARLRAAGVPLFNQAVLLRGVNDSADTLCALSRSLFAAGVTPYYLHLLDPVEGVAHFEVPIEEARALVREVTDRLPGYLVPKLVRELAGEGAKVGLEAG